MMLSRQRPTKTRMRLVAALPLTKSARRLLPLRLASTPTLATFTTLLCKCRLFAPTLRFHRPRLQEVNLNVLDMQPLVRPRAMGREHGFRSCPRAHRTPRRTEE